MTNNKIKKIKPWKRKTHWESRSENVCYAMSDIDGGGTLLPAVFSVVSAANGNVMVAWEAMMVGVG